MKSARVGVLSIIELKNARWNIEKKKQRRSSQRPPVGGNLSCTTKVSCL